MPAVTKSRAPSPIQVADPEVQGPTRDRVGGARTKPSGAVSEQHRDRTGLTGLIGVSHSGDVEPTIVVQVSEHQPQEGVERNGIARGGTERPVADTEMDTNRRRLIRDVDRVQEVELAVRVDVDELEPVEWIPTVGRPEWSSWSERAVSVADEQRVQQVGGLVGGGSLMTMSRMPSPVTSTTRTPRARFCVVVAALYTTRAANVPSPWFSSTHTALSIPATTMSG